jgi:hypothetical protein
VQRWQPLLTAILPIGSLPLRRRNVGWSGLEHRVPIKLEALRTALPVGAICVCAAAHGEPVVELLVCQGDTVSMLTSAPGPSETRTTHRVREVRGATVNPAGGFAAYLRTDEEFSGSFRVQPSALIWGKFDGASLEDGLFVQAIGRRETSGAHPHLPHQHRLRDPFGISTTGQVVYSAAMELGQCSGVSTAIGLIESIWVSNNQLAVAGAVTGGEVWRMVSAPGVTADGRAYWLGHLSTNATAPPTSSGVYLQQSGGGAQRVLGTGTQLSGGRLVGHIDSFAVKRDGTEVIAVASVQDSGGSRSTAVLLAPLGTPPSAPTVLAATGDPLTGMGALGGEYWTAFEDVGIGGAGAGQQWYILGRTATEDGERHVLLQRAASFSVVTLREGQSVGGRELVGAPKHIAMNSSGDVACVWMGVHNGVKREMLLLNGTLVFEQWREMPVRRPDTGTGVAGLLSNFVGRNWLALSDRAGGHVNLYFPANVAWSEFGNAMTAPRVSALYKVTMPANQQGACAADWNDDGVINTADVTAFLADWFASRAGGTLVADFTGDGTVNTSDITAFLSAWFAGRAGDC